MNPVDDVAQIVWLLVHAHEEREAEADETGAEPAALNHRRVGFVV
jgi:hypothetical protein